MEIHFLRLLSDDSWYFTWMNVFVSSLTSIRVIVILAGGRLKSLARPVADVDKSKWYDDRVLLSLACFNTSFMQCLSLVIKPYYIGAPAFPTKHFVRWMAGQPCSI